MTGYFTNAIDLDAVRAVSPKMIYYGALTCWWTHRADDLYETKDGLPCDPRGGVLFETDDVEGFLKAAEASSGHYGKHGVRAFVAAHHMNCVVSEEHRMPTCFVSWDDYNRILDEFDERASDGN